MSRTLTIPATKVRVPRQKQRPLSRYRDKKSDHCRVPQHGLFRSGRSPTPLWRHRVATKRSGVVVPSREVPLRSSSSIVSGVLAFALFAPSAHAEVIPTPASSWRSRRNQTTPVSNPQTMEGVRVNDRASGPQRHRRAGDGISGGCASSGSMMLTTRATIASIVAA